MSHIYVSQMWVMSHTVIFTAEGHALRLIHPKSHFCLLVNTFSALFLVMRDMSLFISVTWLIYMCDTTHSYVWYHFFFGLIYKCAMTVPGDVWHVSIHKCNLTHLHVWHDSFVRVISPFFLMCDMTQSYLWTRLAAANISKSHVCLLVSTFCALLLVTRLIHMCDMTHLQVWHGSFCDMAPKISVRHAT